MMTNRQGFIAVMAVAAVVVCWAETALAQPFAGGLPQCQRSLNACNANLATCTTQLSACQAAAQQFPATGQTTCSNSTGQFISCAGTGQDGEIQAGGTLSYTDNGNGTITDNNTKLVWEKKSADGTIHDVNTLYTWDNAFAVHIGGLNASNFAGHNDWRLPNVKELQSIVNYASSNPAVSAAFNNACSAGCTVTSCSCTARIEPTGSGYWSSTTWMVELQFAWVVDFVDGVVKRDGIKPTDGALVFAGHVRAVRGGTP